MKKTSIYNDIAKRTDGDIYVGVVGPVRTGKSTFIKRFMDTLVIPNIDKRRSARPSGRRITAILSRQNNNDDRAEVHPRKCGRDKSSG